MYAKIYLGYRQGVALSNCHGGDRLSGKLISERVRGVQVVNLWPYDFPLNARDSNSKPLAQLWKPSVSVVLENEFALSGLEHGKNGQWVAQRWMIEPCTFADLQEQCKATPLRSAAR